MNKRVTKKKFQEMLNQADLERRASKPGEDTRWRNNQYHQRTRLYGDYLRAQDPDMFNANYVEYLAGEHQDLNKYL
jgi:hypothetical protein